MAVILGSQFHDIARLLKGEFERRARDTGLTLLQWRTLGLLNREDEQTQRCLADQLEVSPMTISGIIDRLEAMGFVSRDADPVDRRAKRVSITEEGRAMARSLRPVAETVYARALAGLSEAELATLEALLIRIVDNLSIPPPPAGQSQKDSPTNKDGSKQDVSE